MYSRDYNQIRAGLTNFIGSLIDSIGFEPRATKYEIVKILLEEALKISKDENEIVDIYIAKPFIDDLIYILNQRIQEFEKLKKENVNVPQQNETIIQLNNIIKLCDNYRKQIK